MNRTILAVFLSSLFFLPSALADMDAYFEADAALDRARDNLKAAEKARDRAQGDMSPGDREVRAAEKAVQDLERVRAFRAERAKLSEEYNLTFWQHRADSRNQALYERLHELEKALEDGESAEKSLGLSGLTDAELEERIAKTREEADRARKAFEAEEAFEAAKAELADAQKELDRAYADLDDDEHEAIRAIRKSDRWVDDVVDSVFAYVDTLHPQADPTKDRTIGFQLEAKGTIPLLEGLNLKPGAKGMVYLTRKADGGYRVTVVTEGEVGASVGVAGMLEAGVAGGGRDRVTYEFSPQKSRDMVRMAALLAAAGVGGAEAALLIQGAQTVLSNETVDDVTRWGTSAMANGIAAVGEKSGQVAGKLGEAGGWLLDQVGAHETADSLREAGENSGDSLREAGNAGAEFLGVLDDFKTAFRHMGDPAENETRRRWEGLLRLAGKADATIAKVEGSVEAATGYETREGEDGETEELLTLGIEFKGGATLGLGISKEVPIPGVAGEAAGTRQYLFKKVVGEDRLEVSVLTSEELGGAAGGGVPNTLVRGSGGTTKRAKEKYVFENVSEEAYEAFKTAFSEDPTQAAIDRFLDPVRGGGSVQVSTGEAEGVYVKGSLDAKVVKLQGNIHVWDGEFDPDMAGDGDGAGD